MGRATQGVRLINLGDGEKLAGLEKILERDDEENGNGGSEMREEGQGNPDPQA
jgi:DNA gyrase subunit A